MSQSSRQAFECPLEFYEVLERVSVLRIGVLLLNLVIVLYLVTQLKQHTLRAKSLGPLADAY